MRWAPALYLAAFAASSALSWVLTPMALRLATRRGLLDHPGDYKKQNSPTPYLGGLSIVAAFGAAIAAASFLGPASARVEMIIIVLTALGLSLVGLVDDIRGLGPAPRFVIEVLAALALYAAGVHIQLFGGIGDVALTVLWVVGVTNAFNLLDNMDGLSAGVAIVAAAFFFLIAALEGQFLVAALAAALAGCALGFLRHNFHPAKIYMGDAGSLFLGFMLAAIGIKLRFDGPNQATFVVPILVLGVPIFDTTLVVITRLINGLNPFAGGRDHTSHRLVFIGLPVRVAVMLVYAGSVVLGWLALVASRVDVVSAMMLLSLTIVLGIFIGVLLGSAPVYERSKRRKMMIVEVKPHEEPLAPAQPAIQEDAI